jgi:hypothetical protein
MISLDKYAFIMAGKFSGENQLFLFPGDPPGKGKLCIPVAKNCGFLFTENCGVLFTDYITEKEF